MNNNQEQVIMKKPFLLMILLSVLFISVGYSAYIQLSDQGTSAKDSGSLINGDLTVLIYETYTAPAPIWQETFTDAVKNGSWNVMLGQNPANRLELEFGRMYYKDYQIDGTNLNFEDNSGGSLLRLAFYSPLGYFNNASLFNFSMIDGCSAGYVIREIDEDGSVTCERLSSGGAASGWNDTGTVVELITSTDHVNATTLYVDNTASRVGIGTYSPSRQLSLTDPGVGLERVAANILGFFTGNSERMRIDASGNVAIGGSTASQRLHVEGNLNVTGTIYGNIAGDLTPTGDLDMNNYDIFNTKVLHAKNIGVTSSLAEAEARMPAEDYSMYVEGDIRVGGNILGTVQGAGGDIAENVFFSGAPKPGDVVVISGDLTVKKSSKPYDTSAAGIISTKPAYLLAMERDGLPLALSGIVPTKVVNETGFIRPGDLLTTSSKEGHAMKCESLSLCKGAIVGKALGSLDKETGVIEVLVMLG
ncbi:MAG TPA: hypothetical protein ENN46_01885 [Candidatus Woesearchaeota archaeon]|nr:hypothetical protein [Candidatus Woesearchaeota archaeon]